MATPEKEQYDNFAPQYDALPDLPVGKLETELVLTALGDCTNAHILDLGGGNGLHARDALQAGASTVDVIDISQEMLNIGSDIEQRAGRSDRIKYFHADVSKPLDHLPLRKSSYDVVMVNWTFDHCSTPAELEGMWANVATYVKPAGGRFLGMRVANAYTKSLGAGKYGVVYEDVRDIPDGVAYTVAVMSEPRLRFEGTSMKASYSGSNDIFERHGFGDVKHTYGENTKIVRDDPAFWAEWLSDPYAALTTAVKKK